jgi:hypothetical protein
MNVALADVAQGFAAVLSKPFSRERLRDVLLAESHPRRAPTRGHTVKPAAV